MEMKAHEVPSFSVLVMEPDGGVVRTPLSVRLPIHSAIKKKPAIVVGDLEKFETLFRVKNDEWSYLISKSSSTAFTSLWNTYRKTEDLTSSQPFLSSLTAINNEHFDTENVLQYNNDLSVTLVGEKQLLDSFQKNLKIEGSSDDSRPAGTQKSECKNDLSRSHTVTTKSAECQGARFKSRRRRFHLWKWSSPEVNTEYSSLINSKAAFKFALYCIFLRDPKRVYSMDEYRNILANLGYTNVYQELGLLNSTRSHMRHFRKWDPTKPRGSRSFLQMATNESVKQKYLNLADALLSNLE